MPSHPGNLEYCRDGRWRLTCNLNVETQGGSGVGRYLFGCAAASLMAVAASALVVTWAVIAFGQVL